ncbi:helix-turn-helix domain-containing protein [bacterium]|nr:helix-turn-helix domain-containing protein [Mariniblastus sp.]MDB4483774.1 helix-turn-helix domain-containing protein [bacterium]
MSKTFHPPKPASGCLDRRESASYLSISTRLLDDLAAHGSLPRVKIGRKTLFRVADLDAFIESKVQRLVVE